MYTEKEAPNTAIIVERLRAMAEYLEAANIDKLPRETMRDAANRLEQLEPCKVGDTVWVLRRYHDMKVPVAGIVTELRFTEFWNPLIIVGGVGRGRWGQNIFATKEEAEQ